MDKEHMAIYHDEAFYKATRYHTIDPEYPEHTTRMFHVMKAWKYKDDDRVFWILANKSLTLNNIMFLEGEGWEIIGVEHECDDIRKAKKDMGYDNANIKLTIRKKYMDVINS